MSRETLAAKRARLADLRTQTARLEAAKGAKPKVHIKFDDD